MINLQLSLRFEPTVKVILTPHAAIWGTYMGYIVATAVTSSRLLVFAHE